MARSRRALGLGALLALAWFGCGSTQPAPVPVPEYVDTPIGDRADVAPCGSLGLIDMTDTPRCVEVFEKLHVCCREYDYLAVHVFAVMMRACRPEWRFTDSECGQLLSPDWIAEKCAALRRLPECTHGALPNDACDPVSSQGGSSADCEQNWSCPNATRTVRCSGRIGAYRCSCVESGAATGTFESSDFCDEGWGGSSYRTRVLNANAGCGWSLVSR